MEHFQRATENQSILSLSVKVRIVLQFVAFIFLVALQGPALADDLEEGLAAYRSSDYKTALTKLTTIVTAPLYPPYSTEEIAAYWSRMSDPDREATVAKAQYYLGRMHEWGFEVPSDWQEANRWYTKAAAAGDAEAQYHLGSNYWIGRGVSKNYQQAVQWFRNAAEQGHAAAQTHLGLAYWEGIGVPLDPQQAVQWFREADERHLPFSENNDPSTVPTFHRFLKEVRPLNPGMTLARFIDLYETHFGVTVTPYGDTVVLDAPYYLGLAYWEGKGVPLDPQQAVHWFRKAAVDHPKAQFYLGVAYWKGKGVPLDPQQAVHWFRKAAEQGEDVYSPYYLGRAYWHGKGVQPDPQQAVHWFRKAAEYGDEGAPFYLGLAYSEGKGVLQDYQQAVHWYKRAANQGHSSAQHNLGTMYGRGEGTPQDYVQAHKWYNLAASASTDQEDRELSVKNRDLIERRMSPAQIAEAQRLAREWKPTTDASSDDQNEGRAASLTSSGSGFIVSRQGHVLTNYHVVDNCQTVRSKINGEIRALTVVGTDSSNDLAVLQLPQRVSNAVRFREGRNIRSGDPIVVLGFPLHGLLATEAIVTTGAVSALAGLGNDVRFLQMTAPIQPGSSGGPVLDQSGHIVGMVVSKLDALRLAKTTGDIPQNINFAINGTVLKAFLDANGVEYEAGKSTKKMESADIGAIVKKSTLALECLR